MFLQVLRWRFFKNKVWSSAYDSDHWRDINVQQFLSYEAELQY